MMRKPVPTEPGAPKLTTPALLAVLLGVGTIAAAVAGLLRQSTQELGAPAGVEALSERFDVQGDTPFELEVAGARRLPRGELYVGLVPASGLASEPDPAPFNGRIAPKRSRRDRRGGGRGSRGPKEPGTEWGKIVVGETETLPVEAAFLFAEGTERADALLREQFSSLKYKDIGNLKSDGETVPTESGQLAWGTFDAKWVALRHYELVDGVPTFHDTLRVNLTTSAEARVLYMRWARGLPADPKAVDAMLAVYSPRE